MGKESLNKMITLATSAFGLVAALAWNEAIQTLFKEIFGATGGIVSLFIYAIIVTAIAVWVTSRLSRMAEKIERKEKESKLN